MYGLHTDWQIVLVNQNLHFLVNKQTILQKSSALLGPRFPLAEERAGRL